MGLEEIATHIYNVILGIMSVRSTNIKPVATVHWLNNADVILTVEELRTKGKTDKNNTHLNGSGMHTYEIR